MGWLRRARIEARRVCNESRGVQALTGLCSIDSHREHGDDAESALAQGHDREGCGREAADKEYCQGGQEPVVDPEASQLQKCVHTIFPFLSRSVILYSPAHHHNC